MKYYTFRRESNDFSDILADPGIKKALSVKIVWNDHLMIGLADSVNNDQLMGYIVLKFGEDIVQPIERDFTPVAGRDYIMIKV